MRALKQLFWLTGIFLLFFSCKKEKSLEQGTATGPSQWEFTDSTAPFKGSMDTAFITVTGPVSTLVMDGTSADASGKFRLEIFSSNLARGTFKTPNVKFSYIVNNVVLYENVSANADKFSVTITRLDSNGVTGVFSGEVETPLGTLRTITKGNFSAKFASSTPSPQPPPSNTAGQLMLWSKKACTGTTKLTVKVQNQSGEITTFHATEPVCSASGTATFNLPPGSYTWKAFCGTADSTSGSVTIAASQCIKKEVIFGGAPPVGTPGTNEWSFSHGSKSYSGIFSFDGALSDVPVGTGKILELHGETGNDTLLTIFVHYPTNISKPTPGTYKTDPRPMTNLTVFNFSQTVPTQADIFTSLNATTTATNVNMSIVITSFNDSTRVLQGTFSGKAWDKNGAVVDITNGKFNCVIEP